MTSRKYSEFPGYNEFLSGLRSRGVAVEEPRGTVFPANAAMHNQAATVPFVIITPRSEWGVTETLRLITESNLYGRIPISVRSGGHGYFNGASCDGIMINLSEMSRRSIVGNVLIMEPGGVLGQTIALLARSRKCIPHGDCFAVGTGGHFLTAGWDILFSRRYGLGCQSVIGGRVSLWDGTVLEVNEDSHSDLLWAMRGGAAASVGIVTEFRLRLIDEPSKVTWRFTRISKSQLRMCVKNNTFARAFKLPRDISVSFRIHFESDQITPVCSLNVFSLLDPADTVKCLQNELGNDVAGILSDLEAWSVGSVLDVRMIPASDFLSANPGMLSEVTGSALRESPLRYWQSTSAAREMVGSFFTTVSSWVVPDCEPILLEIYEKFETMQDHPLRSRMYAAVFAGGGKITEQRDDCSMPLGDALARFELHWDADELEKEICKVFTEEIFSAILSKQDKTPSRPYRGDAWLEHQIKDPKLDQILNKYDRR